MCGRLAVRMGDSADFDQTSPKSDLECTFYAYQVRIPDGKVLAY